MNPNKACSQICLDGKIAVVTGAASGIGFAIAKLFSERGATVCMLDINEEKVQKVAESIPNTVPYQIDITNTSSIDNTVEVIIKKYQKIDILVNCAGIGTVNWVENFTESDWYNTINVNLNGTFFMSQRVGRKMIAAGTGGKIISIASQAGIVAIDKHVAYSASKVAVISLMQSLANEWGKYNIQANAISPTVTDTPMIRQYWVGEVKEKAIENIPMGRFCQPEEVAAVALFLASNAPEMITGANIVIDGGYTIH